MADDQDRDELFKTFNDKVNMAPKELEDWLDTDESKSVGDSDGGESTGHKSGRKIVDIKRTNKADLTDDQWEWMDKVVGYINRHCAQVPDEPEGSDWAYSLKNWGHDPMKDDGCA
ncbi:DUF3140 domain-containing protein [Novosphingopyxis sp. YJ-S2-01]|uniref:DUF3140 domain-containing protein n=1 Tax=Novosphingopyxis sp. YJ-S2-01 TaxID=2794021 RepID=UPI0018DC576A|nr:DUF3140 domain-containing protein [Novosphingopyxis sp. YJ-S2-01]MBH9536452.1 DUF3140 domain-containing protein [Novosphingopyxis sp. YJ-S2-01]